MKTIVMQARVWLVLNSSVVRIVIHTSLMVAGREPIKRGVAGILREF